MTKTCKILISLFIFLVFSKSEVFAETASLGVSSTFKINNESVRNGDLVSSGPTGFYLTNIPYDPLIVGVVTEKPAIAFNSQSADKTYPVVSQGNVFVNVSSVGGPIKKGDLIASSTMQGVGMKATKGGYVVGTSLEDYEDADATKIKTISVSLNIHYFSTKSPVKGNLMDIANLSKVATYEDPIMVFKYFIAAVVAVISVLLGLTFFGRIAAHGVDALGRNPLAGKMIQFGIFLNVLITVTIVVGGFGLAYLIIKM
jgi:hypothetical protein